MIKRRKTIKNRIASLMLASVMVYSLIPVNAIAANHEHNAECGYDISGECTYNQDAAATAAETDNYEYLTSAKSADLTITVGTEGTDYTYENGVLDIKAAGTYEIKNTAPDTPTADAIVVSAAEGKVNIILSGVNIKTDNKAAFQITGNCETNIILKNGTDNTLDSSGAMIQNQYSVAGLQNGEKALVITCEGAYTDNHICNGNDTCGKLTAKSNTGAGIGGGSEGNGSNITISGGIITAKSHYGAGIGGGLQGHGNNITISGGSVTAESMSDGAGAGIGGGDKGNGSNIIISGGTVYAKSEQGAGIGGGLEGSGSYITIYDGTVNAESMSGAGIGGGEYGNGSNITISSGIVTATSSHGAGIGGGNKGNGSDITISGGTVNAESQSSAGIGGGQNGNVNNIIISGGTVTAKSEYGAGIGGGYKGNGSYITISGGMVTAESMSGAGIGGGDKGNGSNITISGGTVTAESDCGAGIGGGYKGNGSYITISGGTVTAGSMSDGVGVGIGSVGAGIGGGCQGNGSNITISGGTVTAESMSGAGIGGGDKVTGGGDTGNGSNIIISGGTVTAKSMYGAGIGGGDKGAGGGEDGTAELIIIAPYPDTEVTVNTGADFDEAEDMCYSFPRRTDITNLVGSNTYFHSETIAHNHADTNKDHVCDNNCETFIGTCQDADKDHNCDYGCGKSFGACADTDKDHNCDHGCGKNYGTHAAASGKHTCDYCGKAVTFCTDFAEAVKPEALKSAADCTNSAVYYKSCTICGANGTETFTDGEALGHTYSSGRCTRCSASDPGYIKPSDVPQTGDNSNIAVWFALLFISGGAVIVLTDIERKKNIQNK